MSAVLDNLRTGGEGRHFDARAALAREQAQAAQLFAGDFMSAVLRNRSTQPIDSGCKATTPLGDVLAELLYDDATAAALVNVMHLHATGKYEAGAKAMLDWLDVASKKHGLDTAELRGV